MRPTRLELKNFLAYRETVKLDLASLHVACLTGPNGAGKSSLLDAITWAIWGKARAKSADDLLHLGQSEMYVMLDYEQEGRLYRVERTYQKRGKSGSRTELHFRLRDGDQWIALNEHAATREVEAEIIARLRLDYDTFITSAYLQQGHADAFTAKTPSKRKELLAEILGLARWDAYEAQAKEKVREYVFHQDTTRRQIADIDAELQEAPLLQQQHTALVGQVADAQVLMNQSEAAARELEYAPRALADARHNLADREQRAADLETDLNHLNDDLDRIERHRSHLYEVLSRREAIEAGLAELAQAQEALATYDAAADHYNALIQEKTRLNGQLQAIRTHLQTQHDSLRKQISTLERDVADMDAAAQEMANTEAELARLDARRANHEALTNTRQNLSTKVNQLKEDNKRYYKEMQAYRERIDKVNHLQEPFCPTCGQPMSDQHRLHVVQTYESEGQALKREYLANQDAIKALEGQLAECDSQLTTLEGELRRMKALLAQAGRLSEKIEKAREGAARLDDLRGEAAVLEAKLAANAFAEAEQARLAEVEAALAALGYDRDDHAAWRQQVRDLGHFTEHKRELEQAAAQIVELAAQLEALTTRRSLKMSQMEQVQAEISDLHSRVAEFTDLAQEAQAREAAAKAARAKFQQLREAEIQLQQRLGVIERQRERRAELQRRLEEYAIEQAYFTELKEAFGPKGVPAWIIEAAIPELEERANDLLVRMTDGRMHLRFDTQRLKRSGEGVIETLDLSISDELGTRDYDLYSGGESFRVNFALRVALSQFLAQRSGARLQTLIIDEGFGSQDTEGRERLTESINAVRSDFDLILIVTHIEELRDAFPTHIEVRKTAQGSTVTIRSES